MLNKSSSQGAGERPLIAIVTETFAPEINGVAHTLQQICINLTQTCDIQVIRPKQPAYRSDQTSHALDSQALAHIGVKGLPIPAYPELRFGLPCQQTLSKLWSVRKPAGIYIATQGPLGWSAIKAARKFHLPVVSGFHTNFHNYSQHYGLGWLRSIVKRYFVYFHRQTTFTLVPTAQVAKDIADMGINNARICSRGVDQKIFNPERRNPSLRQQWGANSEDPVYLYVGRLAREKNVDLALAAFARVQRQLPRARMVLVGGGPLTKSIAARYPNILLVGVKQGVELASYYASADIFLFPSMSETFGNVLLEAAASGLAIVSYDVAAARQHFDHNNTAYLAAPGDSQQFCQFALDLAMQPMEIKRLRNNIRAICPSLQWQTIADQFLHYLVIASRGGNHEIIPDLNPVQSR